MKKIINFLREFFLWKNKIQNLSVRLTEEQKKEIRKRANCPFRGFMLLPGMQFVDSSGNGCGPSGEMRPCKMDFADWLNCSWNTSENIEILSWGIIYPKELNLPRGISVPDWMKIFDEVRASN